MVISAVGVAVLLLLVLLALKVASSWAKKLPYFNVLSAVVGVGLLGFFFWAERYLSLGIYSFFFAFGAYNAFREKSGLERTNLFPGLSQGYANFEKHYQEDFPAANLLRQFNVLLCLFVLWSFVLLAYFSPQNEALLQCFIYLQPLFLFWLSNVLFILFVDIIIIHFCNPAVSPEAVITAAKFLGATAGVALGTEAYFHITSTSPLLCQPHDNWMSRRAQLRSIGFTAPTKTGLLLGDAYKLTHGDALPPLKPGTNEIDVVLTSQILNYEAKVNLTQNIIDSRNTFLGFPPVPKIDPTTKGPGLLYELIETPEE